MNVGGEGDLGNYFLEVSGFAMKVVWKGGGAHFLPYVEFRIIGLSGHLKIAMDVSNERLLPKN